MPGPGDDNSAEERILLADAFRLVLGLVRNSEEYAGRLLRTYLGEGERDRHDGHRRYWLWQQDVLPGGGPSPYDGAFWWSDRDQLIECVIRYWDSAAIRTGPASEEWQTNFGRQIAETRVWGIHLHRPTLMEFLRHAGLQLPEAPAVEDPAAAESEEKPPKPAKVAGGPKAEKAAGGKIEEEPRSTKPWIEYAIEQRRDELVGLSIKAAAEKLEGWMHRGLYSPKRAVGWNRIRAVARESKLLPIEPA